jgi:hypothetical protein
MVRTERLPENVKVVKYSLESRSAEEIVGYVAVLIPNLLTNIMEMQENLS